MTNLNLLGRVLMSVAIAMAAFVPLLVDLSPTHVFNTAWPAHARVHEVWLLSTGAMLGLVALYFTWFYRNNRALGIAMASVLMSCVLGGFFVAVVTAPLYGGILIDPATVHMMPNHDMAMGIPLNVFVFGLAFILLMIGTVIARRATRVAAIGSA
jgi:hypothetical protein